MISLFVPGRLCLFGEHSDWAGAWRKEHQEIRPGRCLVAGTDQGLVAEAEALDGLFEMTSVRIDPLSPDLTVSLPFAAEALTDVAESTDFFSYAAGVAAEVRERHDVPGLRVKVTYSDLPEGKGLSSSAAACVLVARAFNTVYELGLTTGQEMDLAFAGERRTGSECGRMDQICALGATTTLLGFDGDDFQVEHVKVGGSLRILIVDLCSRKDTRQILTDLQACYPDVEGDLAAAVREALGPLNEDLVGRARIALEQGESAELGALMNEAQALFDQKIAPASSELAAPKLHRVLREARESELIWGGKGVGSQGDGAAQLVTRGDLERDRLAERLHADGLRCVPLDLEPPPTTGEPSE